MSKPELMHALSAATNALTHAVSTLGFVIQQIETDTVGEETSTTAATDTEDKSKTKRKRRTKAEIEAEKKVKEEAAAAALEAEAAAAVGEGDEEEEETPEPSVTKDQIIDAAKAYYKENGGDALAKINKKFGIKKASDASEEIFDDLYAALTA